MKEKLSLRGNSDFNYSLDTEFDKYVENQVAQMKLKLKKENLDLSNSMIKKFEKEKEELRKSLSASVLTAEIQENIQTLLSENDALKKSLADAEFKLNQAQWDY